MPDVVSIRGRIACGKFCYALPCARGRGAGANAYRVDCLLTVGMQLYGQRGAAAPKSTPRHLAGAIHYQIIDGALRLMMRSHPRETLGILFLEHKTVAGPIQIWLNCAVCGVGAPSNSICSMRTWS